MFRQQFKFDKDLNLRLETNDKIKNKLESVKNNLDEMIKDKPFLLMRMARAQETFLKKLHIHFPQYLFWAVD